MKFAKNILIVGLTNALDSWTIMAERDVEEVTMSDYASSYNTRNMAFLGRCCCKIVNLKDHYYKHIG